MIDDRLGVEVIGRALRASAGVTAVVHAEFFAVERSTHRVLMEDVLDWIYENHSAANLVSDFLLWIQSISRGREREQMKAQPCSYCGAPGAFVCDHVIGWQRDARGGKDTDNPLAFTCDLVVCHGCSAQEGLGHVCSYHAGKRPGISLLTRVPPQVEMFDLGRKR